MVKNVEKEKTVSADLEEDPSQFESEDEVQEDQYLTFVLGDETYALDLLNVKEILRLMPITPIPQTLDFIKGIINLRGKIIPVMDVRKRFGMPEKSYEERTCIVVVTEGETHMGLVVDHVSEVLEIKEDQIDPVSGGGSQIQPFVRGIGKTDNGVKIIIKLSELIDFHFEENKEAA